MVSNDTAVYTNKQQIILTSYHLFTQVFGCLFACFRSSSLARPYMVMFRFCEHLGDPAEHFVTFLNYISIRKGEKINPR